MKRFFIVVFNVLLFAACDYNMDSFRRGNQAMTFEIRTSDGVQKGMNKYTDSIKIAQIRTVQLTLKDDVKSLNTKVYFDRGENNISAILNNADTIKHNVSYTINIDKPMQIDFIGRKQGAVTGTLEFVDYYGETSSISLELFVFNNLYPVCRLQIKEVKELSDYEYLIDLSSSFDRDARFGGNVISYEYKIGNYYSLTTEKEAIYHIFPTAGTYDVKCRVKDNDGAWSDVVTTKVIIE
jgi:hypothetical protein